MTRIVATNAKCSVYKMMVAIAALYISLSQPIEALENANERSREDRETLAKILPIVHCSFIPGKYERILISQLRDTKCSTETFRVVSAKIGELLVNKAIECLPTKLVEIETPVAACYGEMLDSQIELVSIMRSGDALLEAFMKHFPEASVSKILIQRDEVTALPQFKYMKLSSSIASGNTVIITEPMVATGGTLEMVLTLLKERGVAEKNILIACIVAAPEALLRLNSKFPNIKLVMTVLDEKLNEKKYIVPGLGDFGDRYFGTNETMAEN